MFSVEARKQLLLALEDSWTNRDLLRFVLALVALTLVIWLVLWWLTSDPHAEHPLVSCAGPIPLSYPSDDEMDIDFVSDGDEGDEEDDGLHTPAALPSICSTDRWQLSEEQRKWVDSVLAQEMQRPCNLGTGATNTPTNVHPQLPVLGSVFIITQRDIDNAINGPAGCLRLHVDGIYVLAHDIVVPSRCATLIRVEGSRVWLNGAGFVCRGAAGSSGHNKQALQSLIHIAQGTTGELVKIENIVLRDCAGFGILATNAPTRLVLQNVNVLGCGRAGVYLDAVNMARCQTCLHDVRVDGTLSTYVKQAQLGCYHPQHGVVVLSRDSTNVLDNHCNSKATDWHIHNIRVQRITGGGGSAFGKNEGLEASGIHIDGCQRVVATGNLLASQINSSTTETTERTRNRAVSFANVQLLDAATANVYVELGTTRQSVAGVHLAGVPEFYIGSVQIAPPLSPVLPSMHPCSIEIMDAVLLCVQDNPNGVTAEHRGRQLSRCGLKRALGGQLRLYDL